MNTAIRLYADAVNARTKQENGFDLTDYDERTLRFAYKYKDKLLAVDVNLHIDEMLDTGWELLAEHFSKSEVGIREDLVEKYWPEKK
jgi:V/A-type H+-transporting ATPase subunit B